MMLTISGFPSGSDSKESSCNAGDLGAIPGSGRSPGKGNANSLQSSRLEEPNGQRSLAGYNPWGHKESDMTKQCYQFSKEEEMSKKFLLILEKNIAELLK